MLIPFALAAGLFILASRSSVRRPRLRSQSDKWRLVQYFRTPEACTCALQHAGYIDPKDPTVICDGSYPVSGKVVEWVGFHLRVRAFQSDWNAFAKWSGRPYLPVDGVYDAKTDQFLYAALTGELNVPMPWLTFRDNAQYLRQFV